MLLLSGPPGSGKTHRVLDQLRASARRGASDIRLLTPTATMAEHLRNAIAREGCVVRPGCILTLFQFVEQHAGGFALASSTAMRHLVGRALTSDPPSEFRMVADFRGFRDAVKELIEEFANAGLSSHEMEGVLRRHAIHTPYGPALAEIYARVESALLRRNEALRATRIRSAALRVREQGIPGVGHLLFDGFFTFSGAEIDLIHATAEHADVTVTLPQWEGCSRVRDRLLAAGFQEQVLQPVRSNPSPVIVRAGNMEAEIAEVARRILDEAARGRPFREMGVIIRSYRPYGPALRTSLERFGIPARFYFGLTLSHHPAVQRLVRLVDAMLSGADLEMLLAALQMAPATAGLDRLDFEIREAIPGHGVDALRGLTGASEFTSWWKRLGAIQVWLQQPAAPEVWVRRLSELPSFFPAPVFVDGVSHDRAGLWRLHSAALRAYTSVIADAACVFEAGRPLPLDEFWRTAREALDYEALHLRDQRRNVVHVIDAVEARQWELPVVLVCGLLEGDFPKHYSENPLLPDAARHELRRLGYPVATLAEKDLQEQFLFELATTRATSKLVLSFPAHNPQGEETLPSFFVDELRRSLGLVEDDDAEPVAVRPAPLRAHRLAPAARIAAADLLDYLAERSAVLSASRIETYLECPFQFFAREILRLDEAPLPPRDRLDPLTQGKIIHGALARAAADSRILESAFEEEFAAACAQERIPESYRTERIRLEMLRSLQEFSRTQCLPSGTEVLTEQDFRLRLSPELEVTGRIDRLQVLDAGAALVVDYKYSNPSRLRDYVKESEDGRRVQAGLYMRAAEHLGYSSAGMLFCALRGGVGWGGWHLGPAQIPNVAACVPEELQALKDAGAANALRTAADIRAGKIAPSLEEGARCRYCSFVDICREEASADAVEGAP